MPVVGLEDDLFTFKMISVSLLAVLSVLAITGNGLCIYIISTSKDLKYSPSSYLIRCLLLIHFLQGIFVFPFYLAKKLDTRSARWRQIICDGFRFTYMVTFYCAVYCISLIAIDRFLAVLLVVRYREMVTTTRVWMCVTFLWTYIILLCLVPFIYPEGHPAMEGFFEELPVMNTSMIVWNNTSHSTCWYNQSKYWTMSMLIYNCLLPYLGIVLIHRYVAAKIQGLASRTRRASFRMVMDRRRDDHQNEKITKLAYMLTITYFMTWFPSVTYYIMWSACPRSCFTNTFKGSYTELYVGFFTKYAAFLDAVLSPGIYCFFSEQFRNLVPCLKISEERRRPILGSATTDLV